MNRSDDHDCCNDNHDEDLACEVCEGDTDSQRRGFLKVGLAVGAAAGLAACQKKGKGGTPSAGEMAPGAPKAGGPARKAPVARKAPPKAPAGKRPSPRPVAVKKSRVVQVVNSKAYDAKGKPDPKPVKVMVDTAVMALTGKKTPKDALSSLFKPTEKVGLKPNCLGRHLCWPHEATVDAIIEGLVLAGVSHANMYMWDMWGFNA